MRIAARGLEINVPARCDRVDGNFVTISGISFCCSEYYYGGEKAEQES